MSERWVLLAILACAFVLRAGFVSSGVPYAVGIDEPVIVDRALRILKTGDWNPHGFDYPTLVIYLQVGVTWTLRMFVALGGRSSSHDFDLGAVYQAGRLVAALIGTATVWLTYRLGTALDSPLLGLVAAAQLAVYPMHVRESHFILTDVPTTALVTLTVLLALRAGRVRTASAYVWAGCAAGLSAAAKYNGAVVVVALGLVWVLHERSALDRGRKALAALVTMAVAFIATVPYAVLDRSAFVSGLVSQLARVDPRIVDPPWRTYLIHLSLASRLWLPTAIVGAVIVGSRRQSVKLWVVPLGFIGAYFYVLATHRVVFGRYALPLLPGLCLCASVPVIAVARATERYLGRPWVAPTCVAGALLVTASFTSDSIAWLQQFRREDTRSIAARWMVDTLPHGTPMAVAATGPTYLDHAGFTIVAHPNQIIDHPLESYVKEGVEYAVVAPWSASALAAYDNYFNDSDVVFGIDPSDARWGPYVRVFRLNRNSRVGQNETGIPPLMVPPSSASAAR